MSTQNLIIYKFIELYHILDELSLDLNFNIIFVNDENSLNEKIKKIHNYLIISNKKYSNFNHQFVLDNIPINIFKLIEKINIEFLKQQFNNQSKFKINQYTIDLNSTAVSDANSKIGTSNKFFVAILNKYDRSNTYTSDGSFPNNDVLSAQGNFVYPESDSTVSYRPFLRVTTADTVVDEGVQFKTKIIGGNLKITGGKVEIGR